MESEPMASKPTEQPTPDLLLEDLAALADVPPPDGFAERVMARYAADNARAKRRRSDVTRYVAAAACALFLVGGAAGGLSALTLGILNHSTAYAPEAQNGVAFGTTIAGSGAADNATTGNGAAVAVMAAPMNARASNPAETIVRRVEMSVTVDDMEAARREMDAAGVTVLSEIADSFNAYNNAHITYTIDAARFDAAVQAAMALGEVSYVNESQSNVAASINDARARLAAKQSEQARLMAILERVDYVDGMLAIERRLSEVMMDADGLQAQINSDTARVARPTLTLNLREPTGEEAAPAQSLFWRRAAGTFHASVGAVGGLGQFIVTAAAFLAVPAVIALAVCGIVIFIGRRRRK